MRKRSIMVPLFGLFLALTACGNYTIPDGPSPPSQTVQPNPFEAAVSFNWSTSIPSPASWTLLAFSCS